MSRLIHCLSNVFEINWSLLEQISPEIIWDEEEKSLEQNGIEATVMNKLVNCLSNVFDVNLYLLKQVAPEMDWGEDCSLVNQWLPADNVYKSKMFRIADSPETIPKGDEHLQPEPFFTENGGSKLIYFGKEKKFLMVLSKLWDHSFPYPENQ